MTDQLYLFAQPQPKPRGAYDEGHEAAPERPQRSQISHLPGDTFEDIFTCHIDESAGLREENEVRTARATDQGPRRSECRSCHASIIWVRTERGKRMPLDAEPVDATRATRSVFVLRELENDGGPLAVAAWGLEGTEPHYISHFSTCPNADTHRRAA